MARSFTCQSCFVLDTTALDLDTTALDWIAAEEPCIHIVIYFDFFPVAFRDPSHDTQDPMVLGIQIQNKNQSLTQMSLQDKRNNPGHRLCSQLPNLCGIWL